MIKERGGMKGEKCEGQGGGKGESGRREGGELPRDMSPSAEYRILSIRNVQMQI